MTTTTDSSAIKTGATLSDLAYTPGTPPPAGWRVLSSKEIIKANASGSGYSGTVYVNDCTKQIVIANAGTNDLNDVKSWSTVLTGGSSPEFKDALLLGNAVKQLINDPLDLTLKDYKVSTTGHSWGEGLAQLQSYTFGWSGTGFDGVGAKAIVSSTAYAALTQSMDIVPIGGSVDFISCNTAGVGPFGGGVVGSIGADISGTRGCTVELPSSTSSGILNVLFTLVGNTSVLGLGFNYAAGKLISGVSQHSMDGINVAVQGGSFKVDQAGTASATGAIKPFSYTDDECNSLRTKLDASGNVMLGTDGKLLTELILKDASTNSSTVVTANSTGTALSQEVLSTDGAGNKIDDVKRYDAVGNTVYETKSTTSADKKTTETDLDLNGDGKVDRVQMAFDANRDGIVDQFIDTGTSQGSMLNAYKQMQSLYSAGQLGSGTWNLYTDWSTAQLVTSTATSTPGYSAPDLSPIGAFYESKSAGFDAATSIAGKTFRVLNGAGAGLTATQLAAMDANADGKLSGAELNGLAAWSDFKEYCISRATELATRATALGIAALSSLRASDYAFYTSGNAVAGSAPSKYLSGAFLPLQPSLLTTSILLKAANDRAWKKAA